MRQVELFIKEGASAAARDVAEAVLPVLFDDDGYGSRVFLLQGTPDRLP